MGPNALKEAQNFEMPLASQMEALQNFRDSSRLEHGFSCRLTQELYESTPQNLSVGCYSAL